MRALVRVAPDGIAIRSRNGVDFTSRYPELQDLARAAPAGTILDGEIVVAGDDGRPSFARLGRRIRERRPKADLLRTHPALERLDLPHEFAEHVSGYYALEQESSSLLVFQRQAAFDLLRKVLDGADGDANREPIMTAAEWAFDAATSKNQTTSFLQLCIALEAILGAGADTNNLTRALSDRCAYLLGGTLSARGGTRKRFAALYQLRGRLVHGRTMRLESGARESLEWGRETLRQILLREMLNCAGLQRMAYLFGA